MSAVLELGPGETFLFDTSAGTSTNNLPEGLKDLGADVGAGRPIQAIYSLNFGWNGAYFLAASTAKGAIIRRNNLPPQLENWLIDPVTHTCKRDIATLSVELGPNGSFYARDKDSYRWHNLPDALEEAIQQRLCPSGWLARPDLIVLGADGAFIYSNDRGGHSFALGNYPKLQELVLTLQRSNVGGLTGFALLQWVSMSIFNPGQFIALHNSGHHVAELSPNPTQALNSMAGTFPIKRPATQPLPQRAVSQPTISHPVPPLSPSNAPRPMQHQALPLRKPVPQPAMANPQPIRPPPQHLVSSPIPQAHPARPYAHSQNSAPSAVPQAQPARPMSMQSPPHHAQSYQSTSLQAPSQPRPEQAGNRTSGRIQAFGQISQSINDLSQAFSRTSGGSSGSTNSTTVYNNNTTVSNNAASSTSTYNDTSQPSYAVAPDSGTQPTYNGAGNTQPSYIATGDPTSQPTNFAPVETTIQPPSYSETPSTLLVSDPTATTPIYDYSTPSDTTLYAPTTINSTPYIPTNDTTIYAPTTINSTPYAPPTDTTLYAPAIDPTIYTPPPAVDTTSYTSPDISAAAVDTSVMEAATTATGSDSGGGGFWSSMLSSSGGGSGASWGQDSSLGLI